MRIDNDFEQTVLRTFLKEHPIPDSWNDKLFRELIQKALIQMPTLVRFDIDFTIELICNVFDTTKELVFKKVRYRDTHVFPRFFIWYYINTNTGLSFDTIGQITGGFNHSTVIHGINKLKTLLFENKDKDILFYYEKIEKELKKN